MLPLFHSTMAAFAFAALEGLIHASIVTPPPVAILRDADVTCAESSTPSSRRPCPTSPLVKVAPLFNVRFAAPISSKLFPLNFHHAASPVVTEPQVGVGVTVNVATLLVIEPTEFEIITE